MTRNAIGSDKPIEVSFGGTGIASANPYAVICAGTTSTSPLQPLSTLGTASQVLTSNGAGVLPSWQNSAGGVPNYTPTTPFPKLANFTTGSVGLVVAPVLGSAYYVKIGDMIYITLNMQLSAKGSSTGDFYVSGMPAASGTVPDDQQILSCNLSFLNNSPSTVVQGVITTNPIGGGTAIRFRYPVISTGASSSYVSNVDIGNTTSVFITGVYV